MPRYTLRVTLFPNPPLGFEPETDVWRDIEVDGSHTLTELHRAIFEAFERLDMHAYEFFLRDSHGIAMQRYVPPQLYEGSQSWAPMDDAEIDRFLDREIPNTEPKEAKDRFRSRRKNPPEEGNAAETTFDDMGLTKSHSLFYEFDFRDSWEHLIEIQEHSKRTLDSDPVVVAKQGEAPPQYPRRSAE